MENKTALANKEVTSVITEKGKKFIDKFNKVKNKIDNNMWELAKVVSDTVKATDFDEMFGNQQNYANAIGMSRPNLNKIVNSYERKKYLEDSGVTENFRVSQIEELLPIEKMELVEFINEYNITTDMRNKDIRSCVKSYKDSLLETEEESEVETEEESEVLGGENVSRETLEEALDEPMFVNYKGKQWVITNPNNITQLVTLLDELNAIEEKEVTE